MKTRTNEIKMATYVSCKNRDNCTCKKFGVRLVTVGEQTIHGVRHDVTVKDFIFSLN